MIANKPSEEEQDIGRLISNYYWRKNDKDYHATAREIENLRINKIVKTSEKRIRIELARPGLLIGRRGQNLIALEKEIGFEIDIVESFNWNDILVPCEYDCMVE